MVEKANIKATVMKAMADAAEVKGATAHQALAAGLVALAKALDEVQEKTDAAYSWSSHLIELPTMKYLGVHKPGSTHRQGHFVTHAGSIWHCQRTTTEAPGDGADWVLACKGTR